MTRAVSTVILSDGKGTQFKQPTWVDPDGNLVPVVSLDSEIPTYRAAIQAITPVAAPTDVLRLIGDGTLALRLKRVRIGGSASALGELKCEIIRRSTAGTAGSATLTDIVTAQHDLNDAAAVGKASYVQTANYTTVGTAAGVLAAGRIFVGDAATAAGVPFDRHFSELSDEAVVLRAATDAIWVNLGASTLPSGTKLDIEVEWQELPLAS